MRERDHHNHSSENQRAFLKPQPKIVGHKVAQRGAQRVGNQNRQPVKNLIASRSNVVEFDFSRDLFPDRQNR